MQESMPQLPAEFRRQYRELGLPAADVLLLADELPTARYFDAVLTAGAPAKPAANWVMGDIMAFCKASMCCSVSNGTFLEATLAFVVMQTCPSKHQTKLCTMQMFC